MKTAVYLAIVLLLSISGAKSDPPILSRTEDVTLEKDQSFRIQCTSTDGPISWYNLPDASHSFEENTYTLDDGTFGNEMVLKEVTHASVGYYYCIKSKTFDSALIDEQPDLLNKLIEDEDASRIYIFVRDIDNLIVPISFPFINANSGEDTIVPCKPTTSDTPIELVNIKHEIMSSETSHMFDPKKGFVININGVAESGDYKCRPKYPSIMNDGECIDFMVQLINLNHRITKRMVPVGNGYGLENASIVSTITTSTVSSVTTTEKNAQTTNNVGKGLMVEYHTTKRSRRKNYKSTLRSPTDQIHAPSIYSENDGHAEVGGRLELKCYIDYNSSLYLDLMWILPDSVSVNDRRITIGTSKIDKEAELEIGKSRAFIDLVINNVSKKDAGYYKCKVRDHGQNENHHTLLLTVLNQSENYVNLTLLSASNQTEYILDVGKNFQIAAEYKGYPRIQEENIVWMKNGKPLHDDGHYQIKKSNKGKRIVILAIDKVSFEDRGAYTLEVNNTIQKKSFNFVFKVRGKPEVHLEDLYVKEGEEAVIDCTVLGFPEPFVAWEYQQCDLDPFWPSCRRSMKNFNVTSSEKIDNDDPVMSVLRIKFIPEKPGYIKCLAQNKYGDDVGKAELLIGDIAERFVLEGYDDNHEIAIGDEVELKCSVLRYNTTSTLYWEIDGHPAESTEVRKTPYSYQSLLRIPSIEFKDSGVYKCYIDEDSDPKEVEIIPHPTRPLVWDAVSTGDKTSLDKKLADSLELNCQSSGLPRPSPKWYKDDVEIFDDDHFTLSKDNEVLSLKKFVRPEDDGQFKCVLTNRLESIEKSFRVNVIGMNKLKAGWIFLIIAIILGLLALIIYLAMKVKRKNMELKKAGLYKFAEGNIEQYNPALDLDEQAELLPYDETFEVPKESLKLGKQLGAGAFGVVVEAIAHRIVPGEEHTKVAVKMVKRTADNEVIMALVSELKIMIHMGKHLNVVNLLGAVTKKIAKREIMIIVEHCRFGNVQNILMKNRKYFVNQINPETDKIDPTIKDHRSSACEYEMNIASKSDNDPRSGTRAGRPNSRGYIHQSDLYNSNIDSCNTEQTIMTTIPEGEGSVLSNNSVQPAWRSNYKPDNTESIELTTSQLVQWAFQVARGMDYLASKKVLHGDLAARNILLCEDNVVKICDFGLARSMCKGDNYKKQGEARLPIKWLALESLESQVFSTYTDVWSFGIVLWEFFSLAKVPYPGMDVHPNFLNKLKDGYRMEKPTYANQDLYDIMLECWNVRPESRPLFHDLENKFGVLLGENDANHYMQLNEPYMLHNNEYFSKRDIDLNILRPPEMLAPKAPIYVNGNVIPQIIIDKGNNDNYLQMNANVTPEDEGIFSPTRKSDEMFNYPTLKNKAPEEIPMLQMRSNGFSDSEGEQSPDADSRSRGFHELNHSISSTDDNQDNDYLDSSSYLGMNGGTRDAFSNPSYHMLKTVNEK
ncbi:KDR family protein [Megaselia abdita]